MSVTGFRDAYRHHYSVPLLIHRDSLGIKGTTVSPKAVAPFCAPASLKKMALPSVETCLILQVI